MGLRPDHELGGRIKNKGEYVHKNQAVSAQGFTIRLKQIFPHKKGRSIDLPFLVKASI
jgi:hypothetical protein